MADEPVEYTRFVLAAHGRSGSTVVTEGFRQHSHMRMYGEVFHEDPAERVTAMGGEPAYEDAADGRTYLREVVYRERWWDELQALGFKLFADHARTGPAATAWEELRLDPKLHVVRLVRDDWLRTLVSYEVAVRTDEWVLPTGRKRRRVPPFPVAPNVCQGFFDGLRDDQAWLARAFPWQPAIDIEYERDVAGRYEKTMRRLFEFLGLEPVPCDAVLRKQARRTPCEQLTNYDELRTWFRGTDYEGFFDR